ncbi:hypothetical protein, partial [Neobacillus sp. LXY-1]|uniref:hypothetical protein n=1 Tax=Neobacillus sp. LXY-1 TaxID=3379133 RepID=UPI003EE0EE74
VSEEALTSASKAEIQATGVRRSSNFGQQSKKSRPQVSEEDLTWDSKVKIQATGVRRRSNLGQ